MTDTRTLLAHTADLASGYLESLDRRPVGGPVDLAALRAALGGPLPDGVEDPVGDGGLAGAGGRRGTGRLGRSALLRVRRRRQPAGRPGRRLADLDLGPERRPVRPVAGGRGGRGGRRRLARRAARPAVRDERRVRDRRHDGQLHRPGRGPPRRAGARPAGTSSGTGCRERRRSPSSPTTERTSRSTPRSRCSAWAAKATAFGGSPPTTRAGCARTRCARPSLPSTARSIVCTQAGNVNTGAFDPFEELIPIAHERGAWVHVDGAFGIWAAAVPSLQDRMRGHVAADSWSTDAHKWLNVPVRLGPRVRP